MTDRELAGIAAQLYAQPFDNFVAARTAAAKALLAGQPATPELRSRAAEVRALPKPSVSAWAVNMLAWHRPEALRDLAELGHAMRAAQTALDAATLRSLAGERRKLLAGAIGAARAVAEQHGRKISGTVATEVEQTLRAATADEGAALAVRSGRLLRALTADGVDVVELAGAVAVPDSPGPATPAAPRVPPAAPEAAAAAGSVPSPPARPRLRAVGQERPAPSPSARERALAALEQASDASRASAAEADLAAAELGEAAAAAEAQAQQAAALREQLARAETGLREARKRLDQASAAAQQAARAADKDRRREDLARERVLRLGNTPGG
ncbi:hypothetical protein E7Y32_02810 [Arthrobacter sp. UKPF54-2]|uniref:hypothetical protein n=1 Tax=Arthrobacter sp. UKPF54-2 TaxID=2600159 RepID=UPI0011B1C300|nr:hypothetical protein [Arthrobacter sp. UKPF54-2]QDY89262.1 hypothetical protein E7Y32_02810 [Arthrobacter sp. UKPF54-2]